MYFKNNNNFLHGVNFHHFHDDKKHLAGQGSINKDDLNNIIKFIGRDNILNADEFCNRVKENKLGDNKVCFTFDDGIKSQIDVALPILEDYQIKSFFFVYTSLFEGNPDPLEAYRFFRLNYFKNVDEFYEEFFKELNDPKIKLFLEKREGAIKEVKRKSPYYSINDIKFRQVRDYYIPKDKYKKTMNSMFAKKNFEAKEFYSNLFLNKSDLLNLKSLGNTIGLHSHTHPTSLENLDIKLQKYEYQKNQSVLSNILNIETKQINSMSHPCGSYNIETLETLIHMGIEVGFKHLMVIEKEKGMKKINNSNLEIARQDHTAILKLI